MLVICDRPTGRSDISTSIQRRRLRAEARRRVRHFVSGGGMIPSVACLLGMSHGRTLRLGRAALGRICINVVVCGTRVRRIIILEKTRINTCSVVSTLLGRRIFMREIARIARLASPSKEEDAGRLAGRFAGRCGNKRCVMARLLLRISLCRRRRYLGPARVISLFHDVRPLRARTLCWAPRLARPCGIGLLRLARARVRGG